MAINPASDPYWSIVQQEAQKYGVNPDLLAVQEYYESGWSPSALSSTGAFGISQFEPTTAAEYGVQPGTSVSAVTSQIAGQADYMAQLLKEFGGSTSDALAAYNAGPSPSNWNNSQTKNYVSEIMAQYSPGGSGGAGYVSAQAPQNTQPSGPAANSNQILVPPGYDLGPNAAQTLQEENAANALFGPTIALSNAGYQQQSDALNQQLGENSANLAYQNQLAGQSLQDQLASYGLQSQQLGLQSQQLGLTEANQASQESLTNQNYGTAMGQLGLEEQGTNQTYQNQTAQYGLSAQSLAQQLAQAQYNSGQQQQQLTQSDVGNGVYNSGTQQQGSANIAAQLGYTTQANQLQQQQLGLNQQNTTNQYLNALSQYGLQNVNLQNAQNAQTYQYGLTQSQDQLSQQQLGLSQQQIGLGQTEANQSYQNALAQNGLNSQLTADQLKEQLGQLQSGQASNLAGILPSILSYASGGASY